MASRGFIARPSEGAEPVGERDVPLGPRERGRVVAVRVDGNDALAVFAATKAAVARASRGDGPTLIETITYRTEAHTTADDDTRYRSRDEVESWRKRDPIERLETYMLGAGVLSEADVESVVEDAKDAARTFRAGMFDAPHGDPLEMFEHVYVDPPASMLDQRDLLAAELAAREG